MDGWERHLRRFAATLGGLIALSALLVWLANPYGNLASSPLRHVLMDDNQRFQYPAVIRSRRYDSLVIGTSTSRLLEPAALEGVLGGRFANLALNSGTAWEQWQLAHLFAREVPSPRTLLIGLDHVWCAQDADTARITPRGFPEWMFDDSPWNDLAYMLNARALEIAGRRLWHALGRVPERWPHNGYEVFVPPESAYDLRRAREHIHGRAAPPRTPARKLRPPPEVRPDGFPALAWLEDLLTSRRFHKVVLATMPIHVAGLPKPGTPAEARERNCKAEMARIAARHGLAVIDFRRPSPITREDSHYWDGLHFRVPIATRVVEGIGRALAMGADDPEGDWRILNGNN
jgi:hypothetical protein